jgi:tetratricopeptide (TPR) repeat protein
MIFLIPKIRWVVLLLLLSFTCLSYAEQSLSPRIYAQLVKAQTLMDAKAWTEAKNFLQDLSGRVKQNYPKALIAVSLGQISINQEKLKDALVHFQQAYEFQAMKPGKNLQLLHSIGQLHCGLDEWVLCSTVLTRWAKIVPEQAKANDYIMIANAFSMTEEWWSVIHPVNEALKRRTNAPLQWYQLRVVAYSGLEKWAQAIIGQQTLLNSYPNNSEEWRRLVSLYLQLEDYKLALATMRIPFHKGLLATEKDYQQIAQLMLYNGVPYLAGVTLTEGLDNGAITETVENLKILASAWQFADEKEKAKQVLIKLVTTDPQRRWYKQLAQLHFQTQSWQQAVDALRSTKKLESESKLDLMLGIALINLQQYDNARLSLAEAAKDKSLKIMVDNWLQYLIQIKA